MIVNVYRNLGVYGQCDEKTIRKIQKRYQDPEQCHHLRVSLEAEYTSFLYNSKCKG